MYLIRGTRNPHYIMHSQIVVDLLIGALAGEVAEVNMHFFCPEIFQVLGTASGSMLAMMFPS